MSIGPVDPTIDLSQPGGPFPYGEAILTDGAGGYTIAATIRSYLIVMKLPQPVNPPLTTNCEICGIDSTVVGLALSQGSSIIGTSIILDRAPEPGHAYDLEILARSDNQLDVVAVIRITDRCTAMRFSGIAVPANHELSARLVPVEGRERSLFTTGLITLELEC